MWDVRARACVYELSTGNNGVVSMLWDDKHDTLMAATERGFSGSKYRKARIPRWATWWAIEKSMKEYQNLSLASNASTAEHQASGEAMDTTGTVSVSGDIEMEDTEEIEDNESDWEDEDEDEDGEDEDKNAHEDIPNDVDEGYSRDKRWPERAYHNERFFGFTFDAYDDALCELPTCSVTSSMEEHTLKWVPSPIPIHQRTRLGHACVCESVGLVTFEE